MSFQSFLTYLFSPSSRLRKAVPTRSKKEPNGSRPLRPILEPLEERTVPSFSPTDFAQFGQKLEDGLVALQTPLNTLYAAGNTVPLLGNRLKDVAALNVFADEKLKGISEKLAAVAPVASDSANGMNLRRALFDILGPAGTNLIPNIGGLDITPNSNNNTITVRMPFNKNFSNVRLSGGFGLGLAGLPFSVTAAGGVIVGGNFSQTALFSFAAPTNTATAVTGTFSVTTTANLDTGSAIQAKIGFLQSTLTDNGTSLQATYRGDGSSRQVTFNARVRLHAEATFGGSTQFPTLSSDFVLNWSTNGNANATPQTVSFNNVSVGLGEFLTDMLRPIIEKVQLVTGPLQPVADFLKTTIPGVSDLAEAAGLGQFRIKDLIQAQQTAQNFAKVDNQIELALRLADFIDTINGINPNGNLKINLGNLDLAGNTSKLVNFGTGANLDLSGGITNWQQTLDSLGGSGVQIKDLLNRAGGEFELSFPLITDPVNSAFRLFVGRQADLVVLDLGYKLDNKPQSSGSIFGIAFGFNGGVSIDAKLRLGYDTYGLQRFIETGETARLADGFYVDDQTHFRLNGKIGVFAGAGIVVLSIAIEGGLVIPEDNPLNITLNRDVAGNPDNDPTRLHFDEVRAHPDQLFKASGEVKASINIVVTVGVVVTVPIIDEEVTIGFTKEFEIASVTIFNFSSSPNESSFLGLGGGNTGPQLAVLDADGGLTLSMGPKVGTLRGAVPRVDGNEEFFVTRDGNTIWVLAYGLAQAFPSSAVSTIYADGGSGNDSIIVDETVNFKNALLRGGPGNDHLIHAGYGFDVALYGDDGSDVLVGGFGQELLDGGRNNDVLIGNEGDDQLLGGEGDDKLFGGAGVDFLAGSDGNDEIDTGFGADSGRDFAQGGNGADTFTIYPGIGSPVIFGGTFALLFYTDDSKEDKVIVNGSPGRDLFDVDKSGAGARINIVGSLGQIDNPTTIGIEQIFIEPGKGADNVNINDLTGSDVRQVLVNQRNDYDQTKFLPQPTNQTDTVIVNATNSRDVVSIHEAVDLAPFQVLIPGQPAPFFVRSVQQVQFLDAAGKPIGPIIVTPNVAGDQLVVNTRGGNDQVVVTADTVVNLAAVIPAGTVQVATGGGNDVI